MDQQWLNVKALLSYAALKCSKINEKKGIRFYQVNRRKPTTLPFWIFSNDHWNLLHSTWLVPHLLERERSF
jgi:hypothetical protein